MSKPLALLHYENLMPGSQLSNKLMDLGYRVHLVQDLSRLVETCQTETPLLVVTEIVAGSAALGCISALRKNPATQHIPVLGYSSTQEPGLAHQAAESGVSLLVGHAAVSEHLPRLLDQVLQIE